MSHIFISYSHQDSDYTHRLEGALKQRGFDVWIDQRIDYGTSWPQVIQEHLDASAAVIVIMTPRAWDSNWVQNELARAQRKGKALFPLLLEGDCWLAVEATRYVDVRNGKLPSEDFYDRLAQIVPPRHVTPTRSAASAPIPEEKPNALAPCHPIEPEMILIHAGDFLMGSDPAKDEDAEDNEQRQHILALPDYYLARTPVTNAQYLSYVQATGERIPYHWYEGKPPIGKEEHPVVCVTGHEAVAYCRWLAEITGKPYRLPSEAEWEKGARGTDGRIYPWGNDWDAARCNCGRGGRRNTTPVGDTTPVGAYPNGASPYGLLDMAGNVWEWTWSLWGKERSKPDFGYPYNPSDGRENPVERGLRVLRGGCYASSASAVRCGCRHRLDPRDEYVYGGFRVCRDAQ